MKKSLIIATILALTPLAAFGAVKAVQTVNQWDYIAQINTDTSPILIYKVIDGTSTCYVASQKNSVNGGAVNGLSLSCSH